MPYGGPPEDWIDPMTGLPANAESLRGIGNMAYGIANLPAQMAKSATEEAGSLQRGGSYEARPVVDAATLTLGGAPKVGGAAGVFGGRLSQTANHELLARAEAMAAQGMEAKSIWAQTGWFRGADGKWRYEIPDVNAKLTDLTSEQRGYARTQKDATRSGPMGEVLEHPELYEAYPQLAEIPTMVTTTGTRHPDWLRGGYLPKEHGGPSITVDAGSDQTARSALLHETMHGIQDIEGFAQGGSPHNLGVSDKRVLGLTQRAAERAGHDWETLPPVLRKNLEDQARFFLYERKAGEVEPRNVQTRANKEHLGPPWLTEGLPREQQTLVNPRGSRRPYSPGMQAAIQRPEDIPSSLAPFPQYAEHYPDAAPPQLQTDKASGKQFLGKGDTPETKAFEKARGRIQQDMKKGYEPYFPPEERFYPDPSKYPERNVDTLTLKPERQETIDKYLKVIDAPETRKSLRAAYDRGLELGNANDWYAMGQLEKVYISEFGPKAGRQRFMDEFAVPMAATTSGNTPPSNFLMGQYLEYLRKNKMPIPEKSYEMPVTVGGRRAATNVENYKQIRGRGGYAGLGADQPKMHNFARSFMGDLSRGVMDEQMSGGMLAHAKDPRLVDNARKSAFGLLERPLHEEAALATPPGARAAGAAPGRGVLPGNYQDVAWAGFKGESAGPMINVINDAIERTHRLTGMPRDEIVKRGLLRKEIPMYALGALAPVGMLANQSEIR